MAEITFDVPGARLTAEAISDLLLALTPVGLAYVRDVMSSDIGGNHDPAVELDEQDLQFQFSDYVTDAYLNRRTMAGISSVRIEKDGGSQHGSAEEVPLELVDQSDSALVTVDFTPYFSQLASIDLVSSRLQSPHTFVMIRTSQPYLERVKEIVQGVLKSVIDVSALVESSANPFRVFIGHGGDAQWEVVRNEIERAGYEVEAFESDERVGQATLEVVENMISSATTAVVVMTSADETLDGRKLARQNVIHEIGFAQGKLGVGQTLILLEDGTEEFTNIAGITQIRFRRGEIHRTSEALLAALANRERAHVAGGPAGKPN